MELEPVSSALGVEIRDVDLANLDDNTFEQIRKAFYDYGVMFFRE